MSDGYAQYKADCQRIREANTQLLADFEMWLLQQNLAAKTVKRHIQNVDFYVNEFLLYEDTIEPQKGIGEIGMFLGYWFIKKALWASPSSIRSNAASLKKFYTFLHERGMVRAEDLKKLKEKIKEELPEWVETMKRYDDPDITDMDEVWGFRTLC